MPRTKKTLSVEEELKKLEKELDKCEAQIRKDMDKKEQLVKSIESRKMGMLYQAISESGKSVDEVISWLQQDTQQNTEHNTEQN